MLNWRSGALISALLIGCGVPDGPAESHQAVAEGFFRGIYGCEPALIDTFGAENVVVSYPIFEALYQTPAIRGLEATRDLSSNFCRRWGDPEITFDQVIEQDFRVVLIWSFSAVDNAASPPSDGAPRPRESWGGISAFRIDDQGKVVEEVGEESSPGPAARLRNGQ